MFAYCRSNPVRRVDISGSMDQDCYDNDPYSEEDLLKTSEGGGGAAFAKSSQPSGNTFKSGNGTSSGQVGSQPVPPNDSGTYSFSNNSGLPQNGTTVSSDQALDMAIDFLGPGYSEESPGRFVSSDGMRQVRMGDKDLLGLHAGGPHINFNLLSPKYKNVHVFFHD